MTSHLDRARSELQKQRNIVSHEMNLLKRQMSKIDRALAQLAPVDKNGTQPKNRPNGDETRRREDVLSSFRNTWLERSQSGEFDMDDFLETMVEPAELRGAFQALIRSRKHMFDTTTSRGVYKVRKKG